MNQLGNLQYYLDLFSTAQIIGSVKLHSTVKMFTTLLWSLLTMLTMLHNISSLQIDSKYSNSNIIISAINYFNRNNINYRNRMNN